jgi:hypothetical protein
MMPDVPQGLLDQHHRSVPKTRRGQRRIPGVAGLGGAAMPTRAA